MDLGPLLDNSSRYNTNRCYLISSLRQVHWMSPKRPWNYTVKGTPKISSNTPPSLILQSVSFFGQLLLWVTKPFEASATNDPNMTLNTVRSKVPHIYPILTLESQIWLRLASTTTTISKIIACVFCCCFFSKMAPMLNFELFYLFFFQFKIQNSKKELLCRLSQGTHKVNISKRCSSQVFFGWKRFISVEEAAFCKFHFRPHQITPNLPWTLQGQSYPHIRATASESQISFRFAQQLTFPRYLQFSFSHDHKFKWVNLFFFFPFFQL